MNLFPDNSKVDGLLIGLSGKVPAFFENEVFQPA